MCNEPHGSGRRSDVRPPGDRPRRAFRHRHGTQGPHRRRQGSPHKVAGVRGIAQAAAAESKKWSKMALIVGLALWAVSIVCCIIYFVIFAAAASSTTY